MTSHPRPGGGWDSKAPPSGVPCQSRGSGNSASERNKKRTEAAMYDNDAPRADDLGSRSGVVAAVPGKQARPPASKKARKLGSHASQAPSQLAPAAATAATQKKHDSSATTKKHDSSAGVAAKKHDSSAADTTVVQGKTQPQPFNRYLSYDKTAKKREVSLMDRFHQAVKKCRLKCGRCRGLYLLGFSGYNGACDQQIHKCSAALTECVCFKCGQKACRLRGCGVTNTRPNFCSNCFSPLTDHPPKSGKKCPFQQTQFSWYLAMTLYQHEKEKGVLEALGVPSSNRENIKKFAKWLWEPVGSSEREGLNIHKLMLNFLDKHGK